MKEHNLTRKFLKSVLTVTMILSLIMGMTAIPAYARLEEVNYPVKVTSFKSTDNLDKEYLRVYAKENGVLKVIYRTPLKADVFYLSLYKVGTESRDMKLDIPILPITDTASDGTQTYGFTYLFDTASYDIPNGNYNLYLKRGGLNAETGEFENLSNGILYKNMELRVADKNVHILKYMDVINKNREISQIGNLYPMERYLDNTLSDITFVMRDPATKVYDTMTENKISYIKTVSDKVTAGAVSDYDKLLKIYEYTAGNFYYDTIAFKTHSLQYANPYDNIYSFENQTSGPNANMGKVATTCQGYSAIFLALARAQSIPTRFIYGHRLAVPSNDWITESNIDVLDHWWVEAYVNGRWIFVDPTVGTTSRYNKNTGSWLYSGVTNYTYFDPSEDQIATSHVSMNVYPDYRKHVYLTNEHESEFIGKFLEQPADSDDGLSFFGAATNGSLLNQAYNFAELSTWGNGKRVDFQLDGKGNVQQIRWNNYGLSGKADFSDFTKMTLFSAHGNSLTSAKLSGDSNLSRVFLMNNKLESLDLTDCFKLSYVRVQKNPMKDLSIYVNGSNRTFQSGDNGTFYFTINTAYKNSSFSLYSRPDIGYKVDGIYDADGQKVAARKTYHFTPKSGSYKISFGLDPNSYKYTLSKDDSQGSKKPYIKALVKRLTALGYVADFDINAETLSYDDRVYEGVRKFQIVNGLLDDGVVDKTTWGKIFDNSALAMVSDSEYGQLLSDYEAAKEANKTVSESFGSLSLKVSSAYENKKIKLSWDLTGSDSDSIFSTNKAAVKGFEIYRSADKNVGFAKISDIKGSSDTSFVDNGSLTKGTKYYYKVRAYAVVYGKIYYSGWSNLAVRKAK